MQNHSQHFQVGNKRLQLITLPELAAELGVKPKTLQNRFTLNPNNFPPRIQLPGHNQSLFRIEDVNEWLTRHLTAGKKETNRGRAPWKAHEKETKPVKRLGAPTKRERLEKRQAQK